MPGSRINFCSRFLMSFCVSSVCGKWAPDTVRDLFPREAAAQRWVPVRKQIWRTITQDC